MEDCYNSMDVKTRFCCASMTGLALAIVILMAASFGAIEPTQYGILYDKVSKTIDPVNIQEGGLQFIGPLSSLVKFPRTHQVIEFSDFREASEGPLATRTAEGLELKLHVSFTYQLLKDQLPSLYALAGTEFDTLYRRIAANVIL